MFRCNSIPLRLAMKKLISAKVHFENIVLQIHVFIKRTIVFYPEEETIHKLWINMK